MLRLYLDPAHAAIPPVGHILLLPVDEAEHAAVRRVRIAEAIELLDGRGTIARAAVTAFTPPRAKHAAQLSVTIESARTLPPTRPHLEIRAATPKGDRSAAMVDQLAQLGVASWRPLLSARTIVDPHAHKLERLARVAVAAAKQSGRAHLMSIAAPVTLDATLAEHRARTGESPLLFAADAAGSPLSSITLRPDAPALTLLIGPEGGWTPEESAALQGAGVPLVRLGPHTLRTETAAVAAAAILLRNAI
ncbi:MAG: 16S rRNA (uracil(1498)-N(3))-methyltransferase [Phycisphaerales bacterium]